MTSRIQHIISEIRSKQNGLMDMLKAEKVKNAESLAKNEELNSKLTEMEKENLNFSNKNATMSSEIESLKENIEQLKSNSGVQAISTSQNANDHVQIDELVREIEYCIGQLKNNA